MQMFASLLYYQKGLRILTSQKSLYLKQKKLRKRKKRRKRRKRNQKLRRNHWKFLHGCKPRPSYILRKSKI